MVGGGPLGATAACAGGALRGRSRQFSPADPLRERRDLRVRRQLQLLLPDLLHDLRVAERSRRIARDRQRPHQSLRGTGIGRVERRQPAPPEDRATPVLAPGGRSRGRLEQRAVVGRDPFSLFLRPTGEVGRPRQMEVAQKRAGVQPRGLLERARRPRDLEGRQIHLDQLGIEPQVAGAEDGLLGAQLLAQRVERLVETAASALLLLLPPEQCRQAVPVHPALAGAGQDREDRETPRLLGVAAQRAAIVEHRHPAERLDVLHE